MSSASSGDAAHDVLANYAGAPAASSDPDDAADDEIGDSEGTSPSPLLVVVGAGAGGALATATVMGAAFVPPPFLIGAELTRQIETKRSTVAIAKAVPLITFALAPLPLFAAAVMVSLAAYLVSAFRPGAEVKNAILVATGTTIAAALAGVATAAIITSALAAAIVVLIATDPANQTSSALEGAAAFTGLAGIAAFSVFACGGTIVGAVVGGGLAAVVE